MDLLSRWLRRLGWRYRGRLTQPRWMELDRLA
jgi:hypothetical protein